MSDRRDTRQGAWAPHLQLDWVCRAAMDAKFESSMGAAQMAQPIATIAKAECEAEAKLPEDSASFTIAAAASPISPPGEAIKSIPTLRRSGVTGDEFTDAILDTPRAGPQSSPLVPELPANTLPTAPAVADVAMPRMAPGVGGFNIDPPAPRADPVEREVAIKSMQGRLLLKPELDRQPLEPRRNVVAGIDDASLVFNLLMAVIAIVGLVLLGFHDQAGEQVPTPPSAVMPLNQALSGVAAWAHPALVVTQSQKGFANEPLPLGVFLKDGSGGETVAIAGLAKGSDLSLGTSQGAAGWLLSARDLDKAFVGPPKNFVGVIDAKVELSSASGQLLESQVIRLEWIEKTEEGLKREAGLLPALAPADPTVVVPPLNSEQIAALIKLADDLLGQGDIATARLVLKCAAIAGNAQAALELGLTFDQSFLARSGTLGVSPDTAQARAWYERALKLGSTEASRHLRQLANTPK
jgi:hypothetical protein